MATAALLSLVALALMTSQGALAITIPPGCTYDMSTGTFTCDFRSCLPLNGEEFVPPPQKLIINNIYGTFLPNDFTNFTTVNQTAFDSNYDAELTLECYWGTGPSSLLTMNETTFMGMDWYRNVNIKNCEIEYLIPRAFQHLHTLNRLTFEGGYINFLHKEAFHSLSIEPDNDAVLPRGELEFRDVDLIVGGFRTGLLDPLQNLEILTVVHSRFVILPEQAFKNLHRVHTLTLDDNPFTYLPQAAFNNMTALNRVSFANIQWQCGCGNLWFIEEFADKGISLTSEANCALPEAYTGTRAVNFWDEQCAELKCDQGTIPSIDLGVTCLTYLQVAIYGMSFLGFFQMLFVLYLCYKVRKKALKGKDDKSGKAGIRAMTPRVRPPRMQAPVSHARQMGGRQQLYGGGPGGMSYA